MIILQKGIFNKMCHDILHLNTSGYTYFLETIKKSYAKDEIIGRFKAYDARLISYSDTNDIFAFNTIEKNWAELLTGIDYTVISEEVIPGEVNQYCVNIKINYPEDTLLKLYEMCGTVPTLLKSQISVTSEQDNIIEQNELKLCSITFAESGSIKIDNMPIECNIKNTLLSTRNGEFYSLVSIRNEMIIITLKPYAFKILCEYHRKFSRDMIALVLNDVVYQPIDLNQIGLSPQIIFASKKDEKDKIDLLKRVKIGNISLQKIRVRENNLKSEMKLAIILLVALFALCIAILMILRRRRRVAKLILGGSLVIGCLYSNCNSTYIIASLLIHLIIGLLPGDMKMKFGIFILSYILCLLLGNVMLLAWLNIIYLQSVLAIVSSFIVTSVGFKKEKI